jgi:predicted esterase
MSASPAGHGSAPLVTRHRETVRTARYHVAGAPPSEATHICFALHGYGQLAHRLLRHFEGVIPETVSIVAPEALSRCYIERPRADKRHLQHVGASWLTREDREHEIADAIRWLDLVHTEILDEAGSTGATTSVLGFSQGVATATRWIMRGRVRPSHLVAWAGGLAAEVELEALAEQLPGGSLIIVAGAGDELATTAHVEALRTQLATTTLQHDVVTFDGGHHLDTAVLRALLPRLARGTD